MKSRLPFFRQFLHDWRTTGSVTPSSRFLVNTMVEPIDFTTARCIVELGAGEGCITRALLKRMHPDAKLFAFETNKELCAILQRIQDARLHVINDSAEHIGKHLRDHEQTKAEFIVSGLPLVALPKGRGTAIVDEVQRTLKDNGAYIQFQYSLSSKKDFRQRFGNVSIRFVPLNLPPAFVYVCSSHTKIKEDSN